MEISVELKENSRYLIVKDEQITNKLAINMAMQCKSLLPPIQQENKIIYNLEQLISINEYLSGEVSRDKGFTIIKKLLQEFMNLSEYLLSDADIILQMDSVFWDSNTEKIYFVPASEILNDNSISKFIHKIVSSVSWSRVENKSYLNEIMRIVDSSDLYERWVDAIDNIMGKPVAYLAEEDIYDPVKNNVSAMQPPIKPSIYRESEQQYDNNDYSALTGKLDDTDDNENYGETTVLGINGAQPMIFPILVRAKTGEKSVINKSEYLIGKDASKVDCCIFDNSAVSRIHAKIVSKNGEFFVIDNHSTNHVYVNGMLIDPDTQVRLTHGARVRLGDEDFEFRFQ